VIVPTAEDGDGPSGELRVGWGGQILVAIPGVSPASATGVAIDRTEAGLGDGNLALRGENEEIGRPPFVDGEVRLCYTDV